MQRKQAHLAHQEPREEARTGEDAPVVPERVLITGTSSGLGAGLAEVCVDRGARVYGLSRRSSPTLGPRFRHVSCDLSRLDDIPAALETLLSDVESLDLVVLNAGATGEIRAMPDVPLDDLRRLMDVNVWSNKVILDWLHRGGVSGHQIVAISSGAAVLGNRGWNGYSISKAALNMLVRLYAHEFPNAHLCALAPGLVDSKLTDYLCRVPDPWEYPAIQRIRDARGTERMPQPQEAAERVLGVLPDLRSYESGSYVDIRQITAPEEYQDLLRGRDRTQGE